MRQTLNTPKTKHFRTNTAVRRVPSSGQRLPADEWGRPRKTSSTSDMKGLAGSAGAVAVIALGHYPGARGSLLRLEPVDHGKPSGVDAAGSPLTNTIDVSSSRRPRSRGRRLQVVNDDALEVNVTVRGSIHFALKRFLRTD